MNTYVISCADKGPKASMKASSYCAHLTGELINAVDV